MADVTVGNYLTVFGETDAGSNGATQQPSSIILSLSKERCGGKAGASKDEGCGLEAGARGGCFEGRVAPPQHEVGGCGCPPC